MKAKHEEQADPSQLTFPHVVTVGSVSVKIYKVENRGRPSFMLTYFCKGKRTQKMFADFAKSVSHATSVAGDIGNGEVDGLSLKTAEARAYRHALSELEATGVPLELAVKEYAAAYKILQGRGTVVEAAREYIARHNQPVSPKTVGEAVQDMLKAKEREGASAVYRKILRLYLEQFAKACPIQVRSVTTSHVADFLRDLKVGSPKKKTERPANPRTKNNARTTLGAFFKFCRERGWVARDHDGIEFVPKFREKGGEIEILSVWEITQYLTYGRKELVPFLAIGAFAGLRTAEITRLDWSEVHVDDKFIEVKADKAKTASRRIVPMSDNLAAWLKGCERPAGRVMPFDNVAKQIGWLVKSVNLALRKEAEEARQDPDKAPQVKWKHNGLRHSFISYRVAEIQNTNQVALEAGNSAQMIFKHYRELVRPAEAKKWFSLTPTIREEKEAQQKAAAQTPNIIVLEPSGPEPLIREA